MKVWVELEETSNLLKNRNGVAETKWVVRIGKRGGEVKHPKLRTSVTKRMMLLRELQGGSKLGKNRDGFDCYGTGACL